MRKLEIFDSTLRDGAQGEGISFSVSDKISIVKALDEFGVDYIEAGNPGSNPKDIEFFQRVKGLTLKNARLCAFGSTCRKGVKAEEDQNILSLLTADTATVSIFGKAWDLHVLQVLGTSLKENLRLVSDSVEFFKAHGKEVIFDAEHFFDGYRENPAYALKVLSAAHQAGADVLCLCDTNGGMLPDAIHDVVQKICSLYPDTRIGVHCHNDAGCAVASSLLAVRAGAVQVQGTFTGIGERCGNADLSSIIPGIRLKMGLHCIGDLSNLRHTAIRLSELCNMSLYAGKPYVGASAFAHKGGMHIDGVSKLSCSFEHVPPDAVGNERRFLMSEVSGRTTVLAKLSSIAPGLNKESPEVAAIVTQLKELEHQGFQFEAADAALIMVTVLLSTLPPITWACTRSAEE